MKESAAPPTFLLYSLSVSLSLSLCLSVSLSLGLSVSLSLSLFLSLSKKITHCLDSQTLTEYISLIVLDYNEKLLIIEVLEVLIGVGTSTSTNSFDTQSLQFIQ